MFLSLHFPWTFLWLLVLILGIQCISRAGVAKIQQHLWNAIIHGHGHGHGHVQICSFSFAFNYYIFPWRNSNILWYSLSHHCFVSTVYLGCFLPEKIFPIPRLFLKKFPQCLIKLFAVSHSIFKALVHLEFTLVHGVS